MHMEIMLPPLLLAAAYRLPPHGAGGQCFDYLLGAALHAGKLPKLPTSAASLASLVTQACMRNTCRLLRPEQQRTAAAQAPQSVEQKPALLHSSPLAGLMAGLCIQAPEERGEAEDSVAGTYSGPGRCAVGLGGVHVAADVGAPRMQWSVRSTSCAAWPAHHVTRMRSSSLVAPLLQGWRLAERGEGK